MATFPKRVTIIEEAPREGFQSSDVLIPLHEKIELIDALSTTGLKHIQVVSFVNPKRVPGMADADAVASGLTPRDDVSYTALWLNEKGLIRAIDSKIIDVRGRIVACASEPFLMRNQNTDWAESIESQRRMIAIYQAHDIPIQKGIIQAAFGCNFAGDIDVAQVMRSVETVINLADAADACLEQLTLADTMGWASPAQVQRVIGAVRNAYPDLTIVMHLHDTRGLGMANAYASLQMGVDHFDTAIGGVGGCPFAGNRGAAGNVCTEDFAFLCEEMGIDTGLNLERLIDAAHLAESIFKRPLPGAVMKGGLLSSRRAALRTA